MSRVVHRVVSDASHSVAIVQTASSGGRSGQPSNLSTVRLANADLSRLLSGRVLNNAKIEVIETWRVDAANQGPRSNFGKTLEAMKGELTRHLPGQEVSRSDTPIETEAGLAHYVSRVEASARMKALDAKLPPASAWAPPLTHAGHVDAACIAVGDTMGSDRQSSRQRARL